MKHLHLFESHQQKLDMPVHISFDNYKKYEPYLDDPDVFDLVDTLNQLWYDMEQMPTDDDTQNEVGRQLEELERQINQRIVFGTAEREESEQDEEIEELKVDAREKMQEMLDNVDCDCQITSVEYDDEENEVLVAIDIDGEDTVFVVNDTYVSLDEFEKDIDLGKFYYSWEKDEKDYDKRIPDFEKVFQELLDAEGEAYQEFLAKYS